MKMVFPQTFDGSDRQVRELLELALDDWRYDGKRWLAWSNGFWETRDEGELLAAIETFFRDWREHIVTNGADPAALAKLAKLNNTRSIQQRARWLTLKKYSAPNTWDSDPDILQTPGGQIVDLKTGQLNDGLWNHYCTKTTGAVPKHTELGDRQLEELLACLPDWEVRRWVQWWLGQSLYGANKQPHVLMLVGNGANGKSLLLNVIRKTLGDYAILTNQRLVTNGVPSKAEQLRLKGTRLAVIDELKVGAHLSRVAVKDITDAREISVTPKYSNSPVKWKPSHSVVIASTHLPVVTGADYSLRRRLRIVPFNVQFDDNPGWAATIRNSYELRQSMLAWLVDGALMEEPSVDLMPATTVR